MNPFRKFIAATSLFRNRYGQWRGVVLWLQLLREKWTPNGILFPVVVPGFLHPIYLRAHTSDVEVFCQIFVHAELEHDIKTPVDYIIDAGANIGLSSIFLAKKYPNAVIDAIEVS